MFRKAQSRQRNKLSKFSPRLECLEDRMVLATRTWDGGALSNNWSNASNWVGNISPVAGDDLVFPAGNFDKTADNDYADDTLFGSITVGGGYTLKGNRLRVGAGGIVDNSGTSNIIQFDLTTGLPGEITRTIHVGNGSTLFLDGELSGVLGFIKAGTGDLSLLRNNSHTGQIQVNAGRLFMEKDEALGDGAGGTIVRAGATLFLNDTNLGYLRVTENITLEQGATLRAKEEVELSGTLTTLGTATVTHTAALSTRTFDIHSTITGSGGLTFASGEVRLFGENTYLGTTTVATLVRLQSDLNAIAGNLVINSGGEVRLELPHQISDLATVAVNGTGRLEFNGKNDTISSLTMVGGTVRTVVVSVLEALDALSELRALSALVSISDSLTATSAANGQPAHFKQALLELTSPEADLVVNDGPGAVDAMFLGADITGGYLKRGAGVLQDLSRAGNLARDITVEEGTLRMDREHLGQRIIVSAGAKLTGVGEISALTVQAGGRVRPGTPADTGILKVKDHLLFHPSAILEVRINGSVAGSSHDQIDVGGSASIDGANLEAILGTNAVVGQTYRVLDKSGAAPIVGQFTVPPVNAPFLIASPTGQRLAFNYQGGLLNNDLVLTLQNTPPKAPDLALNTTEINEGGTVTATGRLVDPDAKDALRLFINWGDGSRQEVHRPGRDFFSFTHRYRQDGVYTARFEWLDQNNQGNSREFTITVNNVAPALKLRTLRTTASGILLLSGWLSDAGDDRYTATLDFGDGNSRSKTLNRRDYVAVAHRYKTPGTYTLTLTLRDAQGAEQQYQREVVIK